MRIKHYFLLLAATFILTVADLSAQHIIAHRGYWKTEGSAQNSITALIKADSIKAFGSEVDIWLSADGIPVVNHDTDIEIDGRKHVIEDTPLATLRKARLANGEILPTMEEYLDAFEKCKHIKLIIEFKSHRNIKNENLLVQKVIDRVHARGLQDRVEYISFSINIMNQIRRTDPQAKVYYLNGDLPPKALAEMGLAGFDYHFRLLYKFPDWVKDAHNLGMKVNVWTVNQPEDINKMLDLNVDFITTDEPLLTKELIDNRK